MKPENQTKRLGDAVCRYVAWHWRELEYPPSLRDIGVAVGIRSSASVHKVVIELEQEGRLVRDPYKRFIRVVNGSDQKTCEHDWRITNKDFVGAESVLVECTHCHRRTAAELKVDWSDLATCPKYMGEVL